MFILYPKGLLTLVAWDWLYFNLITTHDIDDDGRTIPPAETSSLAVYTAIRTAQMHQYSLLVLV